MHCLASLQICGLIRRRRHQRRSVPQPHPFEQQEVEPNDFLSSSSICTLDDAECRRGNNVEFFWGVGGVGQVVERDPTSSRVESNFLNFEQIAKPLLDQLTTFNGF